MMEKMWAGRAQEQLDQTADDFNSSIAVDQRMAEQDITGSIAHAKMLAAQGILDAGEVEKIIQGLEGILNDLKAGSLAIDPAAEDIHMFVEQVLTERIGDAGKRLHTARSRNDQVAVDLRLYLRQRSAGLVQQLKALMSVIADQAEANSDAIVPGYTHLQRAQPILFAHHLLAYAMMFSRDVTRLQDAAKRMNESPLGACALAGTTYPTSRQMTAQLLGFDGPCRNSIDAVSDRDFCVELLAALSTIMMHLSRFSEEIILWCSWEFHFVELSDAYTTGSSIMPQKKNADMAELVRGKTGRVYGDLMGTLTMLKGLPLAYNKDMQEDKESIFDAFDTVSHCLEVFTPMLQTMKTRKDKMYKAAQEGFINATDLADYLTRKGMPFRAAYKLTGSLVAECIRTGQVLETVPLERYRELSDLFEQDVYEAIDLKTCVEKRISEGGTGKASVQAQIQYIRSIV
ncbi:MAG: argininosuccinate lyase [Oscillibacter sp.]|uniref:argininosuccinate lyase n=1 Tax=uncultured Dysosmobacter sp. TaxID=2591384 RepID=UPI002673D5B7|nr:argininosuccinate lyase [uncultured Dysosmobacter sp.]MDD6409554.1 argininosuccinate lyase [Oscillibacter sp.]